MVVPIVRDSHALVCLGFRDNRLEVQRRDMDVKGEIEGSYVLTVAAVAGRGDCPRHTLALVS